MTMSELVGLPRPVVKSRALTTGGLGKFVRGFTTAGKVFFFISAVFGAISFTYFQQEHYGSCAWFAFLAVFEFYLALKSRRVVVVGTKG
jgi:hypothetical protein